MSATFAAPADAPSPVRWPVAALLAVLWPGLGHLYAGHPRAAVVFALLPPIGQIAVAVLVATGILPPGAFLSLMLRPVWTVVAMAHGGWVARRGGSVGIGVGGGCGFLLAMFAAAILSAMYVRTAVLESYRIPSGAMAPALLIGDTVIAAKGPFVGELRRGDIVVFEYPLDPSVNYVKRVVAVGGDRVTVRDNQLHVEGVATAYAPLDEATFVDDTCRESPMRAWTETLGGRSWTIWSRADGLSGPLADMEETVVPAGHLFVVGDNRDNSEDSRRWGFVAQDAVRGRILGLGASIDICTGAARWDRLGARL